MARRLPHFHAPALRYILKSAETGSIRKAAAALNIAPSAINRHILLLEAELGVSLFRRGPSGLAPTQAGVLVVEHIRQTLAAYEAAIADMASREGAVVGQVKIVALASIVDGVLPQVVIELATRNPGLDLQVVEAHPDTAAEELAAGRHDIGIFFTGRGQTGIEIVAEADTAIGAVMRSDHPLASRGEVTLSECAAFGAVMFAERWMIEDIMAQEFSRTGAHLHARITSNAMSVIRASVAAGVGIGFVTPVGILGEIRRGEIVHVPVTRVSSQIRTLGLFVRSRTARSRATTLVLDHLASVVTGIGNEVRSLGDAGISPPVRPD